MTTTTTKNQNQKAKRPARKEVVIPKLRPTWARTIRAAFSDEALKMLFERGSVRVIDGKIIE